MGLGISALTSAYEYSCVRFLVSTMVQSISNSTMTVMETATARPW
jgi:hypothetical protein